MDYNKILKGKLPKLSDNLIVEEFASEIKQTLKDLRCEVFIGGSFAKETHLSGFDVDIFVRFDKEHAKDDISSMLEKAITKLKPKRLHGSRDYFQIIYKGIVFEIVPLIKIEKAYEQYNVTDVSPLHVSFVRDNIKGLENDVRIAKLFFKGKRIYGAESHINGFSGYILEVLTIRYGGFLKLISAMKEWNKGDVIDVMKHYRDHKEAMSQLNDSKVQSPLIIIDPVQRDRNAAAGLGINAFAKAILAAKDFKGLQSDFNREEFDLAIVKKNAKKSGNKLLVYSLVPVDGKDEIAATKIFKAYKFILQKLESNDFMVFSSGWNFDKVCSIWFEANDKLPKGKIMQGPVVYARQQYLDDFRKKHAKERLVLFEDRLYAIVKRKIDTLKKAANDTYLKDKCKKYSFKVY